MHVSKLLSTLNQLQQNLIVYMRQTVVAAQQFLKKVQEFLDSSLSINSSRITSYMKRGWKLHYLSSSSAFLFFEAPANLVTLLLWFPWKIWYTHTKKKNHTSVIQQKMVEKSMTVYKNLVFLLLGAEWMVKAWHRPCMRNHCSP